MDISGQDGTVLDATSARAYDGTVYTGKKLWNHPLKFDCRVTGLSVLLPGTTTGLRDYGVSGFGGVLWLTVPHFQNPH